MKATLYSCRFIALPIGRWYKIQEAPPKKAEKNDVLERAFKQYGKQLPKHEDVLVYKTLSL